MATDVRKQANGKAKNIVSIITAGALTVTGTIGIAALGRNLKNKKGDINLIGETSITNVDETTLDVEQTLLDRLNLRETFEKYDLMEYEDILEKLPLLEDFDINDKEAVKKRAKAIYNLSEKEVDVDMIVNLIYMINGKYKNIKFSDNKKKYNYLQEMFVSLAEVLDDNAVECRNAQLGDKDASPKFDEVLYPYMFMATTQGKPDDYFSSKQDAIAFAVIVRKQLNNIENKNSDGYEVCAEDYYRLFNIITKQELKNDNANSKAGYTYGFFRGYTSGNVFMTAYLSKENAKKLDANVAEKYNDALAGEVQLACGIDKNEVIEEAIKSGSFGYEVPNYGESVNSKDKAVANQRPEAGKSEKANAKVSSGGAKVGGGSKQVNTPTTNVVIETYVATPITDAPTKPKKKNPVKSTTTPNKKDESNTKVPTTNPNKDNEKNTTSIPTTEKFETPTGKNEEVVEDSENLGIYDSFEEFLKAQEKKKASKGSVNYVDDADSKEMGSAKTK